MRSCGAAYSESGSRDTSRPQPPSAISRQTLWCCRADGLCEREIDTTGAKTRETSSSRTTTRRPGCCCRSPSERALRVALRPRGHGRCRLMRPRRVRGCAGGRACPARLHGEASSPPSTLWKGSGVEVCTTTRSRAQWTPRRRCWTCPLPCLARSSWRPAATAASTSCAHTAASGSRDSPHPPLTHRPTRPPRAVRTCCPRCRPHGCWTGCSRMGRPIMRRCR
mmetsp:Transcript_8621/g.21223  ORF Transcript_8621/g.21223 Transcript_8621/m.21223 type:complete len:223 (-) Transcript_8621:255-923(-)